MNYLIKILITITLIYQSVSASQELKKVTLQLSWFSQFQFAGYYIAKEKGFYEEVGLNAEIKQFQFGIDIPQEIHDQKIDFAIGRENLILEKANNKDIVALYALFQSSPLILIATKESKINDISDFTNKNIMTTIDDASEVSIKSMIVSQNINLQNLKFINHSHNINDLILKKTDVISGYVSKAPYELKKMGIEYNKFEPKDYGFDMYSDILYTSRNKITNDLDDVLRFKQASLKGWEYAYANIEETVDLILRKYNPSKLTKEELIFEANELKKLSYYNTESLGDIDLNKIQRIYDLYNLMGLVPNKIEIKDFILFDNSLLAYIENVWNNISKYKELPYIYFFISLFFFLVCLLIYKHILLLSTIKELKNSNKKLQLSTEKAEHLSQVKSDFLANMSHEIRTPMNGIIGMSHLALEANLNNDQKHFIERINYSAKSLLSIINDILDFSKIEAGKLTIISEKFDLYQSIKDSIDIIEYEAQKKNLELQFNYEIDKKKQFHGDSLRLSQILINLLANAVKFTNKGRISISVSSISNNRYKFVIEDTGIGLTKEEIDKLFISFSQADNSTTRKYGGTGLGLSITKQLINLMNGKLWVESERNRGSRFIFEIDLVESSSQKLDTQLNDKRNDFKNSQVQEIPKRILLVEDNRINQEILIGLLKNCKVQLDIVTNGKEAINQYTKDNLVYDLILMDIQMPIMDGYEATRIIRKKDKKIPIIALSANTRKEDIEKGKVVGMNDYLTKPIDVKKLYSVLYEHGISNIK